MLIRRNLKWSVILQYTGKSLRYYLILFVGVYLRHDYEAPFENRLEDGPLAALSLPIETHLREPWGHKNFPLPKDNTQGVVL